MRKFVATFLLLLVFSSSGYTQISIKKESKVLNRYPGYCAWCCLETLGRHHKIEALNNLVDKRSKEFTWEWDGGKWVKSPYVWVDYGNYKVREHRGPATHNAFANKLNSLNVSWRYQNNYDKSMLKEAVKNKQGCMVIVKWWINEEGRPLTDTSATHAIVILDYNKEGICFFDPNDTDYVYTATHEWFNYYWIGYTLIVDK